MALVWESYKLDPYVQKLAEAVFNFQEKVQDLFLPNDRSQLLKRWMTLSTGEIFIQCIMHIGFPYTYLVDIDLSSG